MASCGFRCTAIIRRPRGRVNIAVDELQTVPLSFCCTYRRSSRSLYRRPRRLISSSRRMAVERSGWASL